VKLRSKMKKIRGHVVDDTLGYLFIKNVKAVINTVHSFTFPCLGMDVSFLFT
jgi:hypothetical protein